MYVRQIVVLMVVHFTETDLSLAVVCDFIAAFD